MPLSACEGRGFTLLKAPDSRAGNLGHPETELAGKCRLLINAAC